MNDAFGLKGKRITSLDSLLLGDDKKASVFFLYNYYDCNSCIDSGYQLVKRIDRYFGRKYVPVISSMGSPSHAQIRNEYVEYVYNDVNDLIRKELKYIQTPIVISLDKNNVILDYIFPNVSDEDEYNRFLSFMDNVSTNFRKFSFRNKASMQIKKEELNKLLKAYYNGSFAQLVCDYIRSTGMTRQEVERLLEEIRKVKGA